MSLSLALYSVTSRVLPMPDPTPAPPAGDGAPSWINTAGITAIIGTFVMIGLMVVGAAIVFGPGMKGRVGDAANRGGASFIGLLVFGVGAAGAIIGIATMMASGIINR